MGQGDESHLFAAAETSRTELLGQRNRHWCGELRIDQDALEPWDIGGSESAEVGSHLIQDQARRAQASPRQTQGDWQSRGGRGNHWGNPWKGIKELFQARDRLAHRA